MNNGNTYILSQAALKVQNSSLALPARFTGTNAGRIKKLVHKIKWSKEGRENQPLYERVRTPKQQHPCVCVFVCVPRKRIINQKMFGFFHPIFLAPGEWLERRTT